MSWYYMSIPKEVLDEIILKIKERHQDSRNRVVKYVLDSVIKEATEKGSIPNQTLISLLNLTLDLLKNSELYISTLEKISFSEIIKIFEEKNKEQIEEAKRLEAEVSEKTEQLYT